MPVQLRFPTLLTGEQYVMAQEWKRASLPQCPLHRDFACGLARHGTYPRKFPSGTRVARWYCRLGGRTFSLLPDCLAARLPGTLAEVEEVVRVAETAASQEQAVEQLHLVSELPGALRWLRRRVVRVRATLITLVGLFTDRLAGCGPTVGDLRTRLGVDPVLPELREIAAHYLGFLPAPVGFCRAPPRAPPRKVDSNNRWGRLSRTHRPKSCANPNKGERPDGREAS